MVNREIESKTNKKGNNEVDRRREILKEMT